jgi:transcriptional regulator with XRE-family HTH domain
MLQNHRHTTTKTLEFKGVTGLYVGGGPMSGGFPERLRTLRKQRNLSQTELAKLVGIHYNHVGRYERGESRPSADTLKRLADALDVSSDYLIEGHREEAARARFEDRELLRQFQEVERLEDEDKVVVKKLLDAFLTKKRIQELAAR